MKRIHCTWEWGMLNLALIGHSPREAVEHLVHATAQINQRIPCLAYVVVNVAELLTKCRNGREEGPKSGIEVYYQRSFSVCRMIVWISAFSRITLANPGAPFTLCPSGSTYHVPLSFSAIP